MRTYPLVERLVVPAMLAYAVTDMLMPSATMTAWIALVAAALQGVRLSGWQGVRTASSPIVWVLHLAYLWLPVGLLQRCG